MPGDALAPDLLAAPAVITVKWIRSVEQTQSRTDPKNRPIMSA